MTTLYPTTIDAIYAHIDQCSEPDFDALRNLSDAYREEGDDARADGIEVLWRERKWPSKYGWRWFALGIPDNDPSIIGDLVSFNVYFDGSYQVLFTGGRPMPPSRHFKFLADLWHNMLSRGLDPKTGEPLKPAIDSHRRTI